MRLPLVSCLSVTRCQCHAEVLLKGLHLVPNSVGLSVGSVFAGYMMHKTGKYKTINATFGCLPFISTVLIASLREDSSPYLSWLSIVSISQISPLLSSIKNN
jgi:hypothetical protein